ncbi:MAG: HK97 family phage prohead protease [Thermomicrobiales bacterium]
MAKQMLRGYVVRAEKDGPIPFVASTPDTARDGMNIPTKAWDTAMFRLSPLLLWSHDYWGNRPPIGRVANLQAKEHALIAEAVFDRADPFAAEIERKMRDGFVNAFSVGFNVHEMEPDGKTVKRAELLEISVVPVPADPKALAEARTAFRSLAPTSPEDATRAFLERLADVDDTQRELGPEERLQALLRPLTRGERRALDEEAWRIAERGW